jgi:hypothetical protein
MDKLAKLFGGQDLLLGDKQLDDAYRIKASREKAIEKLLADADIRAYLKKYEPVFFGTREEDSIVNLQLSARAHSESVQWLQDAHVLMTGVLDKLDEAGLIGPWKPGGGS